MDSPYRLLVDRELHNILLHPCCLEPNMVGLKVLEKEKTVFSQKYWLRDKQNSLVLKKILFLPIVGFNENIPNKEIYWVIFVEWLNSVKNRIL